MYVTNDPALGYRQENWVGLDPVATIPIMLMRKTSGTDASARLAMTPVVMEQVNRCCS